MAARTVETAGGGDSLRVVECNICWFVVGVLKACVRKRVKKKIGGR